MKELTDYSNKEELIKKEENMLYDKKKEVLRLKNEINDIEKENKSAKELILYIRKEIDRIKITGNIWFFLSKKIMNNIND